MLSIFSTIRTRRMGLWCVSSYIFSPPSLLTYPVKPDGVAEILPGRSERGVVLCESLGGPACIKLGAQHKKLSAYIELKNDVVPV